MRLLRGGPGCSRSSDHAEDREQPASAETGRLPLSSPARTEHANDIARSIIALAQTADDTERDDSSVSLESRIIIHG